MITTIPTEKLGELPYNSLGWWALGSVLAAIGAAALMLLGAAPTPSATYKGDRLVPVVRQIIDPPPYAAPEEPTPPTTAITPPPLPEASPPIMPTPVVTTPAPSPPVVPKLQPWRPARHATDICAAHNMHKEYTKGGRSWRCRK